MRGERAVTSDTALRLAKFTGTEPEFWLNLQQAADLWDARNSERTRGLDSIGPAQVGRGG